MKNMRSAAMTAAWVGLLLAPPALAGDPYSQGNGVGKAYIATTQAIIGGTFVVDAGTTASTFAPSTILSISNGIGPSNSVIGPICLDVNSPAYSFAAYPLDVNGNFHVEVSVPNIPALIGAPPIYANALTVEVDGGPAFISVSKTVRVQWELPDSWRVAGSLSVPRSMHTATALGTSPQDDETRVFVAGGGEGNFIFPAALASTELYHPLTRSFTAGPDLSVARMAHRSVRLPDGRVLVAGGMTTGGAGLASCEIFDPQTGAMIPTGSMSTPRIGHALTLLPNAKVLASGGFSDWQSPSTQFIANLNTAQRSAELYDPQTGAWTPIASDMADDRAGHTHTVLPDLRVLIAGGVNGGAAGAFSGQFPTFATSCELYDPFLDQLTPTGDLVMPIFLFGDLPTGRGFHGATLLSNGNVLVTGGTYLVSEQNGAEATASCIVWNGATWSSVEPLTTGVAFHRQEPDGAGNVLVVGGLIGNFTWLSASPQSGRHDGATFVAGTPVGQNDQNPALVAIPTGNHTLTRLFDGTFLVTGGTDALASIPFTRSDALVYVP